MSTPPPNRLAARIARPGSHAAVDVGQYPAVPNACAYPAFFHIPLTTKFVIVTLSAHLTFGVVLGLGTAKLWRLLMASVFR